MEILEKAVMPNGTKIQLEDWSNHNTEEYPNLYGLCIGAYPIAKNTGKWRWVQGGRQFRISIAFNNYIGYTNDNVKADFEALKEGSKKLEDLSQQFYDGEKAAWYLGMDVENKGY